LDEDSEHEGEIDGDTEYITLDDFVKGLFPWQLSEEKGWSHSYPIFERCSIITFTLNRFVQGKKGLGRAMETFRPL